jgi:hypothetical protein
MNKFKIDGKDYIIEETTKFQTAGEVSGFRIIGYIIQMKPNNYDTWHQHWNNKIYSKSAALELLPKLAMVSYAEFRIKPVYDFSESQTRDFKLHQILSGNNKNKSEKTNVKFFKLTNDIRFDSMNKERKLSKGTFFIKKGNNYIFSEDATKQRWRHFSWSLFNELSTKFNKDLIKVSLSNQEWVIPHLPKRFKTTEQFQT